MRDTKRKIYYPATGNQDKALLELIGSLTPILLKIPQNVDIGYDVEYGGWRVLLLALEHHLGTEAFDKLITEYLDKEDKQKFRGIRAGWLRLLAKAGQVSRERRLTIPVKRAEGGSRAQLQSNK